MKKAMLVLLSVLMVVTCVLALTACQENCETLGHDWGEWEQTTDPTCTVAGVKTRTCSRCEEVETDAVAALGHDWGAWRLAPGATAEDCGNSADYVRDCSRCDATDNKTEAATGKHVWVDDDDAERAEELVEATCGEPGQKPVKCSVCGETSVEVIPATGEHTLNGTVEGGVEATCGTEGRMAAEQCSVCQLFCDENGKVIGDGSEEALVIPATGVHAFGELQERVEPKCDAEGKLAYKQCSQCEKFFDAEGELIGESEEDLVIEKLPHVWNTDAVEEQNWKWPEAYDASILSGIKVSVACESCGESYEIEATVSKVADKCVEPTYVDKGTYVLTATAQVGEVTLTSGEHTYNDVPELPDQDPKQSYYLLGTLNNVNCWSNSATRLFKWNKEIQAYQLEMNFYANDEWKVRLGSTWDTQYDGSSIVVTYKEGVEAPTAKALFSALSGGNIKTAYACTVTITLDLTAAHKMNILVTSVDLTEVVAEYWVYGSMNGWAANPTYKFTSVGDGTYKLTVTFSTGAQFKIFGAGSWFGVGSENTLRLTNNSTGGMTFTGTDNINVTGSGTVMLVFNPEARTLVISDAE